MRLIDADALIADSCRDCPEKLRKRCRTEPACADTKFLFEIPTVDAVPVVRCKGCEHAYESFGRLVCGHSIYTDCLVREDFFCADGVTRKENEKKEGAEC